MFTGIVQEMGTIVSANERSLRIACESVLTDIEVGDSIAVNGCCLTVARLETGCWEADISPETLGRTTLGTLHAGDAVNLEPAARLGGALGGHLVQGHVDASGEIVRPAPDLHVRLPEALLRYCVEKGSIAIDGVSLTIVSVVDDGITAAIIPHTMKVTTLGVRAPGDRVNVEVDIMAKHVERLLTFALSDRRAS
jgi:riboflavin synthase